MGGRCKARHNKDENNKLEGMHQKPDQMEETHWEGQNFSEVVVPQEEEEEEVYMYVCLYICMYVCIYVCMYVYMSACMYVCIYDVRCQYDE